MEADWEVELGGGALVIDPHWPGFVDLRMQPERARELSEAADMPALSDALISLNAAASPVWTSKCDVWPVAELDADELDAPRDQGHEAVGCYIDLLPRHGGQWANPPELTDWCKRVCERLRVVPLYSCRIDLVVRHANLAEEGLDLGVTAYLTAAGADRPAAVRTMASVLAALTNAVCFVGDSARADSKLQ